jgi:pimeloyl-ACP methyl ester carboxylesterase
MARPAGPERNRAARSFRQLSRFHHLINSDKVFGTHNGAAALHTAVEARERVTRILAATPVPASGVPFDAGARQLFESAAEQFDSRQAIIDFSTGNRLFGSWSRRMAELSMAQSDKTAFDAYFRSWSAGGFADKARGLEQHMLECIAEHDTVITREAMQATYLADHPCCELKAIANSGHYPMQEVPVWFATKVQSFFGVVYSAMAFG